MDSARSLGWVQMSLFGSQTKWNDTLIFFECRYQINRGLLGRLLRKQVNPTTVPIDHRESNNEIIAFTGHSNWTSLLWSWLLQPRFLTTLKTTPTFPFLSEKCTDRPFPHENRILWKYLTTHMTHTNVKIVERKRIKKNSCQLEPSSSICTSMWPQWHFSEH